jgi:hypothetical protein
MAKAAAAKTAQAPAPPSPAKLSVVYRPLSELIPYARNSRTHSDAQIAQIAASIREFSFTNPVLVDEAGSIIAGHGRVLAARQLQLEEVPTILLAGLSETQRRAYVIADNRLALNAGWDAEMLAVELQALAADEFDTTLLGFQQVELDNIIGAFSEPIGDEDESPWDGMPEFGTEPRSFRRIVVHLVDEAALQDFSRRLEQDIPEKAKSIWHPYQERKDFTGQSWQHDEERSESHDEQPASVSDLHSEQGPR